jgi:hypothetical protein
MSTGNGGTQGGKRSLDELLADIEEQGAQDDMDQVLAMDDAALDRELAAGGFDPAAVRAKGRALGEAAQRAWRRGRLLRGAKIAGLVALAVAIALAAWYFTRPPKLLPIAPEPASTSAPKPAPVPTVTPQDLRLQASTACNEKRWEDCERLLDDARDADPAGESQPEVKKMRGQLDEAIRELEAKPR